MSILLTKFFFLFLPTAPPKATDCVQQSVILRKDTNLELFVQNMRPHLACQLGISQSRYSRKFLYLFVQNFFTRYWERIVVGYCIYNMQQNFLVYSRTKFFYNIQFGQIFQRICQCLACKLQFNKNTLTPFIFSYRKEKFTFSVEFAVIPIDKK